MLADGTRRAIVSRLADGPQAVGQLAAELPVSRSAVSQHLKVLKDAGLVSERAVGTRRVYRLNAAAVAASMTRTEVPVVRKQVVVNTPVEQAFTAFTERFGDFKPPEHNLLAAAIAETVFEPRVGGHIYDRAVDGSECRWARILAYEPPARVIFSWDIGPQWQVETDPELTSEVEVRFVAEGPDRTRVELEHRHLDRHGPGWQSVSDGVDGDQGWPLYLARYAALIEGR